MRPYPTPPRPQVPGVVLLQRVAACCRREHHTRRLGETSARSEGKAGEETWSLSDSTISPRFLHAEADGNRTRQRTRRPLVGFEDRGAHQEPRRLHVRGYRRRIRGRVCTVASVTDPAPPKQRHIALIL